MPTPREVWSAGDWPTLSKLVVLPGEATAAAAAVGPGTIALDVGAGDGNVAIPLAKAGARVTALDPTPELFESGRVAPPRPASRSSGSRATPWTCPTRTRASTWSRRTSARCSRPTT